MAASTLRLFSVLALALLLVAPASSSEDHDWHFDPGRSPKALASRLPLKITLPEQVADFQKTPALRPRLSGRAFIPTLKHSAHIRTSGKLILHQPSTGYPVSSTPVYQPLVCNGRTRWNWSPLSTHLHLSSPLRLRWRGACVNQRRLLAACSTVFLQHEEEEEAVNLHPGWKKVKEFSGRRRRCSNESTDCEGGRN